MVSSRRVAMQDLDLDACNKCQCMQQAAAEQLWVGPFGEAYAPKFARNGVVATACSCPQLLIRLRLIPR